MMFVVVEFLVDNSVAIVNEKWMIGHRKVRWPRCPTARIQKLVREGQPPPLITSVYDVKVHKMFDAFDDAVRCQRLLEELSELPSSDAIAAMDFCAKRKRKPKRFSDTSSNEEPKRRKTVPVDIDLSPPPVLEDMSTATSPKRSQPEATANVSCLWGPVVTTSQVTTHSIIPATSTPIRDTGRHFVQKTETVTKVKNETDRFSEHVTYGKTLVAMFNDLTNRVHPYRSRIALFLCETHGSSRG